MTKKQDSTSTNTLKMPAAISQAALAQILFEQSEFDNQREASIKRASTSDWAALFDDVVDDLMAERGRAWTFITYPESMNPNFYQIVTESGLQGAVSPLHDRDRWLNGEYKKDHFHNLLYFPGKTSASRVKQIVDALGGVMLQPVLNITGLIRYFAHMDIDPEHRPYDAGKVRYSPDDIVAFGGFDVKHHIKATSSQRAQALSELYEVIRIRNITAYCKFVDVVYLELHEYEYIMADSQTCRQLEAYIRSRYAVAHKQDEETALRALVESQQEKLEAQQRQIERLMGGVGRMENVVSQIAHLITGEEF